MQILIREPLVNALTKKTLKRFGVQEDAFNWNEEIELDLKRLTLNKCKNLMQLLLPHKKIFGTKTCIKEIETYLASREGKYPSMMKVKLFEDALIQYLLPTKRRWLYHKSDGYENQWVATSVIEIEYHHTVKETRDTSGHPEYVEVQFIYEQFATIRFFSESFYADDILFKKVPEILALRGYYIETDELRKNYLGHLKKYKKLIPQIGKQYLLKGVAVNQVPDDVDADGGGNITKEKIRDYVENKVVIDIFRESEDEDLDRWSNYGDRHHSDGGYFWRNHEPTYNEEQEFDEDPSVEKPIHPFVIIFDLQRHERLSTHVDTLQEYIYDTKISEKLILPQKIKDLVNILIQHKSGTFVDIVRGKSGGAIVALTGKAGVGKTLTAEVFAENSEKPLYNVQASQLGIDPTEFEKSLKLILRRASRWGAILLLDEADVYVQARGSNLVQNAIVGIFLRVLEYHTSMMFLTTNRPETVDDAILSRCIARIDYEYPPIPDQIKIWKVLAKTSNIELDELTISNFVKKHSSCSGRDIKNLLKLSNLRASALKKKIQIDDIEFVIQFNPTLVKRENK